MKFNEPVTPKGIGRNQVAFNLPVNGQLINIIEQEEGDSTTEVNIQEAVSRSVGLSRVIAHSAASSAINNNYSSPFGLSTIADFTIPTSFFNPNTTMHFAKVKFDQDYTTLQNNGFYLSSNGTTIIPRRSGWYLVNSRFFLGNHKGNHHYKYNAYSVDSVEQNYNGGDILYTQEYPTLKISTVIPVIGFDSYGKNVRQNSDYPLGGIELEIGVYGNTQQINVGSGSSKAWVQCMWIAPLSEAITTNTA